MSAQRQDSLTDQMKSVIDLARVAGCYDAEDWIRNRWPPADTDREQNTVVVGAWQLSDGHKIVASRVLTVLEHDEFKGRVSVVVHDEKSDVQYTMEFNKSDDVRLEP